MPTACPMCRKPSAARTADRSPWPFCSERCRLVDLGKWLGEEYRVPANDAPPPDDPQN